MNFIKSMMAYVDANFTGMEELSERAGVCYEIANLVR